MMGQALPEEALGGPGAEELECKICYCPYSLRGRRPKVLECRHRLCAKCLAKILDLGECPPDAVVCPFCRRTTSLPEEAVGGLPDDGCLLEALVSQLRERRSLHDRSTELLLSPGRLSSLVGPSSFSSSPNCLVITIMEPPHEPASPRRWGNPAPAGREYRSSSLDSMASMARRWTVWNCASLLCQTSARALVWLLGLLYFSSLPLGVYLLIMQKTTVGVLLVSLVPSSLVVVIVYGFCQCLCQEFWDCVSS